MSAPEPPVRYVDEIRIDLGAVDGWDAFHEVFASRLGFPKFYGRNLNAWIDCMTYLDDPEAGMTTVHVRPGTQLVLELSGVKGFAERCPEPYAALLECTAFVNWRRRKTGQAAVLTLSFAPRG